MRRVLLWVSGIATLIVCVAAVNLRRPSHSAEVNWQLFRPSPPTITVAPPTRGPIARTVAAKGVVEPIRQVQVVAKVSGKVTEVHVEDGSIVQEGDVLARLDATSFRTRADAAKTRLETAKTNLEKAEAHLRDIEKDPAAATTSATPAAPPSLTSFPGTSPVPGPSGPSKLEAARHSVEGWKRERKSAEAADQSARTELDRTSIRAPISGVVEDLGIDVGDDVVASPTVRLTTADPAARPPGLMAGFGMVEDTSRPEMPFGPARSLCTILDPHQLRVRAWVDEADVSLVAADQPVLIFLPDQPASPVTGRISKVAPRGRPNGEVVAYSATIQFDDAGKRPKAGMRVNVEVEVSRQESLLGVPVQAVLHRKRRDLEGSVADRAPAGSDRGSSREADSEHVKAVFVIDGDQVRLRPIETGLSDERRVEVAAGLAPGDQVVIGPFRALDTLEDGMVVRVETRPSQPVSLTQRPNEGTGRPTR